MLQVPGTGIGLLVALFINWTNEWINPFKSGTVNL